jgi:NodT family efflux transporter outer membrane factor (OMF) lipoprotein
MRNPSASLLWGTCVALAAALLGACAVGPDFKRPAAPAVERYTPGPLPPETLVADGEAQSFSGAALIVGDWWELFRSPPLNQLVGRALENNLTLKSSAASLRQSQNSLRAGYGIFFPQVQIDAAAQRERPLPAQQGPQTPGSVFNLVTLSGTISYALDVFGGNRRTVEGLKAQVDYQRYLSAAAYVSLTANVVNTAIARAAYAAEIRTTEELIDLQVEQLQVTRVAIAAGAAPYSDALSLQGLIAANRATLAPLKQRVSQTETLLATLQGQAPAVVALPDINLLDLALPATLPVSVPSELVRQRPDILSAEAQLHVASADIGVATAAMFPSISLAGTYGAAGPNFAALGAADGRFWSIGPSVTIPVFQGGKLWYQRKAAISAFQASELSYRQVVLDAFEQVADSLTALEHDAETLQAERESRDAAAEALHLLQTNYRAGLVAYLDVWTADVAYHEATLGYLQAVAQRYQDTVALFVALGGGWWNRSDAASSARRP